MTRRLGLAAIAAAGICLAAAASAPAAALRPLAQQAPEALVKPAAAGAACTTPAPSVSYTWLHCYGADQIRSHYGIDAIHNEGAGQTIVLVDSYGSPTAAHDLAVFHDTYFSSYPAPSFDEVYPNGEPDYQNVGNGQSGSAGAAGWAGEATLDIEWAYAIAPRAHIVLLAVPPAETEGVQGFPNLFKAISDAIDRYPAGTVFSQSFGVTEATFGGAQETQTARFDAVYKKAIAKGDTVLASSGDDGTTGPSKRHRDSVDYTTPTAGWPASSPYVTAVGGTQLMDGWTWSPTSDVAFTADGNYNPAYFAYSAGGSSEPAWNESWLPAATGGGPSQIYPRPSWQDGVAGRIGNGGDHRAVPDVAWDAAVNGGVLVYTSFFPSVNRVGWHVYGGTSAASPQFAGLVALANEQRNAAGKAPLGFLNPRIYAAGGAGFADVAPKTYGTALSGQLVNNQLFDYNGDGAAVTPGPVPGWPVLTGWDQTTGWGVPQGQAFIDAMN